MNDIDTIEWVVTEVPHRPDVILERYVIDWDRVETLSQVKLILMAMDVAFEPGCPTLQLVRDLVRLEVKAPI